MYENFNQNRIITRLGYKHYKETVMNTKRAACKGPIRPLEEAMCEEDDCDPCKPKKREKKKCRDSHSTCSRFTRKSSCRIRGFEDCSSIQSTNYAPCDCGCSGSTKYSSRIGGKTFKRAQEKVEFGQHSRRADSNSLHPD